MAHASQTHYLPADFNTNLVNNTKNIPLFLGCIRPHHKIRTAQRIKMGCVIGHIKNYIE